MTIEGHIEIKPMSVNKAWKGRRYKTDAYKQYEKDVSLQLKAADPPPPPYRIDIEFGFTSAASDIDNPVKCFVDILQKKYGINDKDIYKMNLDKVVVKEGGYVKFSIRQLAPPVSNPDTPLFCKDCVRNIKNLKMNDGCIHRVQASPYELKVFAAKCPEGKCRHDEKSMTKEEFRLTEPTRWCDLTLKEQQTIWKHNEKLTKIPPCYNFYPEGAFVKCKRNGLIRYVTSNGKCDTNYFEDDGKVSGCGASYYCLYLSYEMI